MNKNSATNRCRSGNLHKPSRWSKGMLGRHTVHTLRGLAVAYGLKGVGKAHKTDLIDALVSHYRAGNC